jgi:hypothetical protein
MRILRTMLVPMLGVIGLLPLLGGCDYDRHEDHYRRAYPAGYRIEREGYYRHDGYWDHDRWRDRDDWRRDRY